MVPKIDSTSFLGNGKLVKLNSLHKKNARSTNQNYFVMEYTTSSGELLINSVVTCLGYFKGLFIYM